MDAAINMTLVTAAEHGLTAPGFDHMPHHCQRWIREVVQSVYGERFDSHWQENAIESGRTFLNTIYAIPLTQGSVAGDILYKLHGSGGDGHVGIRILGNRVAENSSVHWDGHDARGVRTLKEFGNFDLIVRLPNGSHP